MLEHYYVRSQDRKKKKKPLD